ncbi:MAG: clostripain-related cysteine peptidase [Vulcanimicrobiota bacterium]
MDVSRIQQNAVNFTARKALPEKQAGAKQNQIQDQVQLGSGGEEARAPKKWTIMHYSAADNNLTSYLVTDVNEMEKVGSTNTMNVVVQLDRGGSNCKRYILQQDGNMKEINSPIIKDLGSTNMSDPNVLANFIVESEKQYPAQHYALIISDHGYAWKGAVEDESHKGWMSTPEIRQGIEMAEKKTGKKLDVVGFDACLMASTEVAHELKDHAGFLVASEQTEGGNGWPYTPLLTSKSMETLSRAMSSKLDVTPREFATKIVETAQSDQWTLPTMSATDLSKMDNVAKATDNFAKQLLDTKTPDSVFKDIIRKTENFHGFKDQYHFAQQVADSKDIKDTKLKKSAEEFMVSLKKAVIAEQHSYKHPNAHGLNAEIPSGQGVGRGYSDLKYAKETLWDEAMNKITK